MRSLLLIVGLSLALLGYAGPWSITQGFQSVSSIVQQTDFGRIAGDVKRWFGDGDDFASASEASPQNNASPAGEVGGQKNASSGMGEALSSKVRSLASAVTDAAAGSSSSQPVANIDSGDVQVGFSPGRAQDHIIGAIRGADDSIRVAAYSFTSKPVAKALVSAHKRGVDVKAMLDKSQKTAQYSSATFVANQGIPTRINESYAIMHNKFLVIDGQTVQTGSFNYSKSAHVRNAENVLVIHEVPEIAARYVKEWQRLWQESEPYPASH